MSRLIFVNLPVADLDAAKEFFAIEAGPADMAQTA